MIEVNAPCKVILTGEHAVVYGCQALAISIEPFNTVKLSETNSEPGFEMKQNGKTISLDTNGNVKSGEITWQVFCDLLKRFIQKGLKPRKKTVIEIESNVPKGMGASSSVAAALSIALYKHMNIPPTGEELFEDVQFVDTSAHGGAPSGIDAMTVLFGPTQLTKTQKTGEAAKWDFQHVDVKLPQDTTLIVIDSSRGGKRSLTGEVVRTVAEHLGFLKNDGTVKQITELTDNDKQKLEPFRKIFQKIVSELKTNGDPDALGKAMNENHELLKSIGASSDEIEKAREIALQNNAYGAKLTGAGGSGGAVIALVKKNNTTKIIEELKKNGFKAFEAKPTKGAMQ